MKQTEEMVDLAQQDTNRCEHYHLWLFDKEICPICFVKWCKGNKNIKTKNKHLYGIKYVSRC